MRMNLPKRWLLTTLVMALAVGRLCAQHMVSDARIIYKLQLPPEQAALLEGSSFTQYMRGHLSRIDMNFNVVRYTYLINSREKSMITLIDNHGDKYLIRSDKEEYDKELRQYAGIQFKDEAGNREIAGYKCRKAMGTMPDGKTFEVYYAPDLVPENRQYNRRFVNLKGIPLQFEIITKTGAKMSVVATQVDLYSVPASYFDVPTSGYKVISKEELQKMNQD